MVFVDQQVVVSSPLLVLQVSPQGTCLCGLVNTSGMQKPSTAVHPILALRIAVRANVAHHYFMAPSAHICIM